MSLQVSEAYVHAGEVAVEMRRACPTTQAVVHRCRLLGLRGLRHREENLE